MRPFPSELEALERRVEAWRLELVRAIAGTTDLAKWQLTESVTLTISYLQANSDHRLLTTLEMNVRSLLFALQIAIETAETVLPKSAGTDGRIGTKLTETEAERAFRVVQRLVDYDKLRTSFLTYAWGGYEIELISADHVRFVDSRGWAGHRDRANIALAQELKKTESDATALQASEMDLSPKQMLSRALRFPEGLDLGGVSSDRVARIWKELVFLAITQIRQGGLVYLDVSTVQSELVRRTGLPVSAVQRAIDILTLDRPLHRGITLFHCPIVRFDSGGLVVVPHAILFGSLRACLPRLAVHKGPGLGAYSRHAERRMLKSLAKNYRSPGCTIRTNVAYEDAEGHGDIDFLAWERNVNTLIIAEAKAFIMPDTVNEVYNANEQLEEAIRQIVRARSWFLSLSNTRRREAMGIGDFPDGIRPVFLVFANGFTGSDYLSIPKGIEILDARYLSSSKFRGQSLQAAIDQYQVRFNTLLAAGTGAGVVQRLTIDGILIESPALVLPKEEA